MPLIPQVLPRSSACLLPQPHAGLLTRLCDPSSGHPMHKFYPRCVRLYYIYIHTYIHTCICVCVCV